MVKLLSDGEVLGEAVADDLCLRRACVTEYFRRIYSRILANRLDEPALRELFDAEWPHGPATGPRYRGPLFAKARATIGAKFPLRAETEQLAADAAADALVRTRDRIEQCRQGETFLGWACEIARRAALDIASTHRWPDGHLSEVDAAQPDHTARVLDRLTVLREVRRKRESGRLSSDQTFVLYGHFWADQTPAQIAGALAAKKGQTVTPGNVYLLKFRAIERLRDNLTHDGYEA